MNFRIIASLLATTCLLPLSGTAGAQERPLGPPPRIGAGLEGSDPEEAEKPEAEIIVPVPAASAKPGAPGTPQITDRTRTLLGELEVLDIPLQEIPNYRSYMRDLVEDLAAYAETRDPGFTVVTRPGFDLLTWSRREFELAEIKRDPLVKLPTDAILQVAHRSGATPRASTRSY